MCGLIYGRVINELTHSATLTCIALEVEINVQHHASAILECWRLIIGVLLSALVVPAVIGVRQPSGHEASVTMFEPTYQVIASVRIESTDQAQKLHTSLAMISALEKQVVQALQSTHLSAKKYSDAL